MNFRKKRKEFVVQRLPLIALIDVVMFLLFYFIMAGTIAATEGELPASLSTEKRGAGKGSDFSSQVLMIELFEGRVRYRIGSRALADQAEMTAVLKGLPKEPGIIIKAADEVAVEHAASAMQASRDAGFERVSYVVGK